MSDVDIVPAIIPENLEHLSAQLKRVLGIASRVQIDVIDGVYAPTTSWPFHNEDEIDFQKLSENEEGLPFLEDFDFEFDLMVSNPEDLVDDFIQMGASSIIIHFESTQNHKSIFKMIEERGVGIGLALKPSTSNEMIKSFIPQVEFVQFMGSDKIGYHGIYLDSRVYEKISRLREEFPGVIISVDIGVNIETAPKLIKAGANKLVSGSALFSRDDMRDAIKELKNT